MFFNEEKFLDIFKNTEKISFDKFYTNFKVKTSNGYMIFYLDEPLQEPYLRRAFRSHGLGVDSTKLFDVRSEAKVCQGVKKNSELFSYLCSYLLGRNLGSVWDSGQHSVQRRQERNQERLEIMQRCLQFTVAGKLLQIFVVQNKAQ